MIPVGLPVFACRACAQGWGSFRQWAFPLRRPHPHCPNSPGLWPALLLGRSLPLLWETEGEPREREEIRKMGQERLPPLIAGEENPEPRFIPGDSHQSFPGPAGIGPL